MELTEEWGWQGPTLVSTLPDPPPPRAVPSLVLTDPDLLAFLNVVSPLYQNPPYLVLLDYPALRNKQLLWGAWTLLQLFSFGSFLCVIPVGITHP